MFSKTTIAAALMGLALTTTPAFADEVKHVQVMYKDLDLTTAAGQRALERRLNTAAREACGYSETVTGSHLPSARSRACYKQARAKAQDVMAAAVENASNTQIGG